MKYALLILIFLVCSKILSQTDTSMVIILPQLEITQKENKKLVSYAFKEYDRNKFVLSDSFLTGNPGLNNYSAKYSDIKKISIRNGSHFWTGAGILGGAGFLLGLLQPEA